MVIGCDPGVTGAISLLKSGQLLECEDLPVTANGMVTGKVSRWLDVRALNAMLQDWSARHDFAREAVSAVIERPIPMPSMPSTTTASSFDTFGAVRAVLGIRVGEVVAVAPKEWKVFFGLSPDKNASRAMALKLYPDAPVSRVMDHNRAESVLLAHWQMRRAA
jgi:hypothetical protein